MTAELGTRRETIFSGRNSTKTDDKRWGATLLQTGAAEVLGKDFAAEIRDVISPRALEKRDGMQDPLVKQYGSALVSTGQALGMDQGRQLSYVAALLFARLGRRREEAQPLLEAFAKRHLQPEEAAIATYISYLLEMQSARRDDFLRHLRPMSVPEQQRPLRQIRNAESKWEELAEYAAQKENPTAVSTPALTRRTVPTQSRGYGSGGRA